MPILQGISSSASVDTTTKSGQSQVKLQEDLNRFLNLLITQLKNQDPLDPLDATEFTSQLVQFASVEQQIHQNANLEKLISLTQASQVSTMVDFIGTTIEAKGQEFPLENGEAKFTYTLGVGADKTTIHIVKNGLTVFSTSGETDGGKHTFTWDGRDKNGVKLSDGTYTAVVTAQDRQGKFQTVTQTVFGRVTGAGADNGVVTMFLGDIEVGLDEILSVNESKTATAN
jgi:flagellar basal-body rod modification protein FlgD